MKNSTVIISHFNSGGSLLYLQQLADALKNKDCQVIFYLPKGTSINVNDQSFCRKILRDPSTCPVFLKDRFLKYLFHLSKYIYNALIIRPGRDVRIVHLLFPFYLTDLLMINRFKRKGIKIVLTVHEIFPHKPFFGGRIDKRIVKRMYERGDLLLVHTRMLKDELVNLYSISPDKIRVVHHGYFKLPPSPANISILKEKYNVPSNKKVLLFFGNIRENKGLDILLKALKGLGEEYFLLITGQVAGAAELQAEYYEKIIKTEKVNDSLYWLQRYISDEEAAEVFKIADAVILPYKKWFYAQSGVLNLAAGYEKPCVASDVGGIGEMVKEYNLGVVVRPEDSEDLKQGIISLFENRQPFGFDRYKKEKNWDQVADLLVKAYNSLKK